MFRYKSDLNLYRVMGEIKESDFLYFTTVNDIFGKVE